MTLLMGPLRNGASAAHSDCLDAESLIALAEGTLPEDERTRLAAHLQECLGCEMQFAAEVAARLSAPADRARLPRHWPDDARLRHFVGQPAWGVPQRVVRWLKPKLLPALSGACALAVLLTIVGLTPQGRRLAQRLVHTDRGIAGQATPTADLQQPPGDAGGLVSAKDALVRYSIDRAFAPGTANPVVWGEAAKYLDALSVNPLTLRGGATTETRTEGQIRAVTALAQSLIALSAGEYDEAVRLAAGASQYDPQNPAAWLILADIHEQAGQPEPARQARRRAAELISHAQ